MPPVAQEPVRAKILKENLSGRFDVLHLDAVVADMAPRRWYRRRFVRCRRDWGRHREPDSCRSGTPRHAFVQHTGKAAHRAIPNDLLIGRRDIGSSHQQPVGVTLRRRRCRPCRRKSGCDCGQPAVGSARWPSLPRLGCGQTTWEPRKGITCHPQAGFPGVHRGLLRRRAACRDANGRGQQCR
jgi:hypothetical protein